MSDEAPRWIPIKQISFEVARELYPPLRTLVVPDGFDKGEGWEEGTRYVIRKGALIKEEP